MAATRTRSHRRGSPRARRMKEPHMAARCSPERAPSPTAPSSRRTPRAAFACSVPSLRRRVSSSRHALCVILSRARQSSRLQRRARAHTPSPQPQTSRALGTGSDQARSDEAEARDEPNPVAGSELAARAAAAPRGRLRLGGNGKTPKQHRRDERHRRSHRERSPEPNQEERQDEQRIQDTRKTPTGCRTTIGSTKADTAA